MYHKLINKLPNNNIKFYIKVHELKYIIYYVTLFDKINFRDT